jgi:hypothetical protein
MSAIFTIAGTFLLSLSGLGLVLILITVVAARLAAFFDDARHEDYRRQALIRRLLVEIDDVQREANDVRRLHSKDAA